jgi:hypothetical protein
MASRRRGTLFRAYVFAHEVRGCELVKCAAWLTACFADHLACELRPYVVGRAGRTRCELFCGHSDREADSPLAMTDQTIKTQMMSALDLGTTLNGALLYGNAVYGLSGSVE